MYVYRYMIYVYIHIDTSHVTSIRTYVCGQHCAVPWVDVPPSHLRHPGLKLNPSPWSPII